MASRALEHIHVTPVGDVVEHDESPLCPCVPVEEPRIIGDAHLWVHKLFRENLN